MDDQSHRSFKSSAPRYGKPDDRRDRIEDLKKTLYSRSQRPPEHPLRPLKPIEHEANQSWAEHPEIIEQEPSGVNVFAWFFKIAVLFFVGTLSYAGYVFFGGSSEITVDNVDVTVVGPVSINGGQPLDLEIVVTNNNNVDLELADLIVEYPEGTKGSDLTTDQPRVRIPLGTLSPGQSVKQQVTAVLFGPENSVQEIAAKVVYRAQNSNAVFEKYKQFTLTLTNSPLSVVIDQQKEAIPGEEIEFVARIRSNSQSDVTGALLRVEYPFGFTYLSSDPRPIAENGVWDLGVIEPGETKEVRIRGRVSGNDGDKQAFRFQTGIKSPGSDVALGAVFATDIREVAIKKPFLDVAMDFDGDKGDVVAKDAERNIRSSIVITNNLSDEVKDVSLLVSLTGSVMDRASIIPSNGYYRSAVDVIVWDKSTFAGLESLASGESVTLSFSFQSEPLLTGGTQTVKNPEILVKAAVAGRRVADTNDPGSVVPEDIVNNVERIVRINSAVEFDASAAYAKGPFQNSGPLPPRVERETTYTILMGIKNTSNTLADGKVVTKLPTYINWNGETTPLAEDITYDPASRTVTWKVGEVPAGAGYAQPLRQAAFKVTILPSLGQLKTPPPLITTPTFTYYDRFTRQTLNESEYEVTTRLTESSLGETDTGEVQE